MRIPFASPKKNINKLFLIFIFLLFILWFFIQIDLINLRNFIFGELLISNGSRILIMSLKFCISIEAVVLILRRSVKLSPKITKSIFNIDSIHDDEAKYNFFKFANLAVNTVITGGLSTIIISAIFGIHIEGDILVLEPDKDIRATFLAIIAGSLTFLTFTENRRRNDIAISKNDWDKQQTTRINRRDRYISLVDKLDSKHTAVRLGAVHALVLLADEWVDEYFIKKGKEEAKDDTEELKSSDIAHKEAQNIVRTLCAYLREPYDLAYKKYIEKKSLNDSERKELNAEIMIRQTLVKTYFKNRLNPDVPRKGSRTWHHLYFNFSDVVFFYETNFSGFHWDRNVTFENAVFYQPTDFSDAMCNGDKGINFYMCTHHEFANLSIKNNDNVNFCKSIYAGEVIFNESVKEPKSIENILIFKKYNNILPNCAYDNKGELLSHIYQGNDELLDKFKSDPEKFRDDYLEYIEKIS